MKNQSQTARTPSNCATFNSYIAKVDSIKARIDTGAIMPTKAHINDSGWDLYTPIDIDIPPCTTTGFLWWRKVKEGCACIDTGVHVEIPDGYTGFLKSKSGLNVKHGLTSDGVIDAGYTGSIVVKLYNHTDKPYHFNAGEKITQLVIMPICTADIVHGDSFPITERGDNGFGSSGR